MSKTSSTQTPSEGKESSSSAGISRWMTNASPPPGSLGYPSLANEVVLFYCSCWQSYSMQNDSTGAGGFLYLTENYIGLVCRSVVGLTKRKELFSLQHLKDVSMWKSTSKSPTRATSSEQSSTGSVDVSKETDTSSPASGTTGGILASLASATGLSFLTSGCKLSFEVSPKFGHSSEEASAGRDDGSSDGGESMVVDVFVIPGVPVEKLRTLLLEARNTLHPDCPHRLSIAEEVKQAMTSATAAATTSFGG